jgi:Ni/Co efflux regulator RcnB
MRKLVALVLAAAFAAVSFQAIAQDKKAATTADKKPTAEQCKKDPKMKGCEPMKK